MHELDGAALLLRMTVGGVMVAHGWNHLYGPGGLQGTAGWFESMGLRPARFQAFASGSIELVSGALLALGLLTSLQAGAVVGVMVVAFVTAHRSNGFFIFKPGQGYEYVAVLAAAAVAIGVLGPGSVSLDNALGIDRDLDGWLGLALSLGLGTLGAAALLVACWRPPSRDTAGA